MEISTEALRFRARTALERNKLSRPVKLAIRDSVILSENSFFDYGCGRGADVLLLSGMGYEADGWDPFYRSKATKQRADVVNVGYVINVIEHPLERDWVLKDAFSLCDKCLIVAAQTDKVTPSKGVRFNDGILTTRQTFQKYFSSEELVNVIARATGVRPFYVEHGIYYAFKCEDARARYLATKGESRRLRVDGFEAVKMERNNILIDRFKARLKKAISTSKIGKRLPDSLYIHSSALPEMDTVIQEFIKRARKKLTEELEGDIIIKVFKNCESVSFLKYRNFDSDPHPELQISTKVDVEADLVTVRSYEASKNPPILHRKECFVSPSYPHFGRFKRITEREEALGLLSRRDIGFRQSWEKAIANLPHGSLILDQ